MRDGKVKRPRNGAPRHLVAALIRPRSPHPNLILPEVAGNVRNDLHCTAAQHPSSANTDRAAAQTGQGRQERSGGGNNTSSRDARHLLHVDSLPCAVLPRKAAGHARLQDQAQLLCQLGR